MPETQTAQASDGASAKLENFSIVHADALKHLPELLAELGCDVDALLREVRIDPAVIGRAGSALAYSCLVNLLTAAARSVDRPDFGMLLAERQRGGRVIGPVGVVMKNSQTLGQALGYCAKHTHAYSVATKVRFRPDRQQHTLFIALEVLLDRVADMRQAVEHALSLASLNIADITGGAAGVRQVAFRHAPQMPVQRYREYFGCNVLFNQTADGILLTEADLLCTISDADEQIYEMATSFIDQRFTKEAAPVHARVRSLVMSRLGNENCTNEHVASELCMHPRTMQRRLRAEGTSFEEIKDEVRRETALRCLKQADMPLTLVAEKLGYAETSVLSRSCYRWFDASPLQLRRQSGATVN